ncbi:AEC family transporter [Enterovirga aerilata]|uniref:AEC family transporter n=1 Tax=Enterovirga aerilata TaxID=2730920 RepID=A0A849IBR2_9HYPH|nr:AEC family transporter [Enterovirga sp. DB1703]NNM73417.1 AEC family transporter [Enterovirga sp. DB1703]
MAAWINAFFPTFALIGLGLLLRWRLLADQAVWGGIDRLTFFVLLPSLLASSISTVKLSELPLGSLATTIWITLGLATVSALILSRLLGHNRAAMTSVVQGGIRFNNYVALAISAGLYGDEGLAFGGVAAGLIVPCVQVILTVVFVVSDGGRLQPLKLLRQIAINPLLLGCLVGFAFAAAGGMPPGIAPLARSLGQAALALGLLSVGGGLVVGALREAPLTQTLVGLQKLLLVPLVTLGLARLFGLPAGPAAIATLTMAMPTASTAYVMARAMGGDARLMAAMITLQHLAAVVTLPLWALFLAG